MDAAIRTFFLLFFILASTVPVHAQDILAAPLKGLRTFGILIEDPNEDAVRCGVTKSELKTDLLFILEQSRMKFVDSTVANDGNVYVAVSATSNCAMSVELQVLTTTIVAKTKIYADQSAVWEAGGVSTGGVESAEKLLDRFAKNLATDWTSVNKN